mmetsp:Transcript_21857/g.34764  ORF Transcript_21857/g.34764 Transcript_21857/m.34764 type:complete len:212 (-) Transcript_21857:15-650(-)
MKKLLCLLIGIMLAHSGQPLRMAFGRRIAINSTELGYFVHARLKVVEDSNVSHSREVDLHSNSHPRVKVLTSAATSNIETHQSQSPRSDALSKNDSRKPTDNVEAGDMATDHARLNVDENSNVSHALEVDQHSNSHPLVNVLTSVASSNIEKRQSQSPRSDAWSKNDIRKPTDDARVKKNSEGKLVVEIVLTLLFFGCILLGAHTYYNRQR